jgi:hypothetical protein
LEYSPKDWTGGASMADSSLNRRMTVRHGPGVAFAQTGICGFDAPIEVRRNGSMAAR